MELIPQRYPFTPTEAKQSLKYKQCFDIMEEYVYCSDPTGCGTGPEALAWDYQCCTQQVLPGGTDGKTDMFPVIKFDVDDRAAYCNKKYCSRHRATHIVASGN